MTALEPLILSLPESPSSLSPSQPGGAAARVVLDTNVLLDWLVFRDPAVAALAEALMTGRLCWIATSAMRQEFERVLDYPQLARLLPDRAWADRCWQRHAWLQVEPLPRSPLRCGDPDDQMFIDLALAARARWLLTKDRELLKLGRRALAFGVEVLPPTRWDAAPLPPADR